MKKFVSNTIAILIIVCAALFIISWAYADSFPSLAFEPDPYLRLKSKRMQNISFSLPLLNTVRNNWKVIYYHNDGKSVDGESYTAAFLPVDAGMYSALDAGASSAKGGLASG